MKRRDGYFNIITVLILIVILFIIIFGSFFFKKQKGKNIETKPIYIAEETNVETN